MGACRGDKEDPPSRAPLTGKQLFEQPFPGTNGRACATCHVPEDHFTLTPAHVARLWETNPNDPLFNAIDADDPTASPLTYEHLKKGLVRVWLTLPDTLDLIDDEGNVTTPADRRMSVWRSVPSVADTAMSAPFQLDGRVATLEEQAQAAIISHSQGGTASASELARIATFQRDLFTSDRARIVAGQLASGADPSGLPDVEDGLSLSTSEQRGREVYAAACAACHGGATKATLSNRVVHDALFPSLRPDGTVLYQVPATDPPTPVLATPGDGFMNIGSALVTYLGQVDPESEIFTKSVDFPRYRYRFYTDSSRTQKLVDLPPKPPPFQGGDLSDLEPEFDANGNPIVGPNRIPQFFSSDPGRAAITGNPNDFEAFDVPTLRGIGRTAPYFHDNSAEELHKVVDFYSQFVLGRFESLDLPPIHPPEHEGPPESLTPEQKSDLIAFLRRL
ncbi:cytochrome-c peroxidase [Myxococcus sp. K38C18041901]|uniref:cytochrome c peroxidase n=1 Tax=Myxococcus guangdongensis TaxID=2906760 RepID=UPI0020A7FA14|nr:cytochrome c peroxidase [Myxococcus guangdongensis]MCP3061691.1 cytochrome-c peroxidase [Myxococcus guangdongensis]